MAGQGVKAGRGCVWVEGWEPRGVLRELCLRAVSPSPSWSPCGRLAAVVGAGSLVMAGGNWVSGPTPANIAVFVSAGFATLILYGLVAGVLGVNEIHAVTNKLRRRLG